MNDMNKATLDYYVELIDNKLLELTHSKPELQGQVVEAMEYSLQAGGKRLRPVLMLEFCRMCGERQPEKYAEIACSIELIHTFFLIHDVLPCMDDDDYRRGKPSCHKAFPENIALLAGDALNTLAFEVIANSAMNGVISADKAVMLISVLARAVGTDGMIGGQVVDVEMTGKELSKEQLEYVYENKTGALIEASMMIGAILAGADEAKVAAVHKIASDVGMAFQIQDDILDVCGDSALLGKPTLSDEENGKVTYVTIHGIDESRRYVTELSERAVRELEEIGGDNEFLKELVIWLINRDK